MEKRKTPRIPLEMEVTYESGDAFISSFLFDINGGGVFIQTSEPLDPGSRLGICFHVPGMSDSFLVDATVVWTQDSGSSSRPGMGVRFEEMGPGDRQRLEGFLREYE